MRIGRRLLGHSQSRSWSGVEETVAEVNRSGVRILDESEVTIKVCQCDCFMRQGEVQGGGDAEGGLVQATYHETYPASPGDRFDLSCPADAAHFWQPYVEQGKGTPGG